MSKTKVYLWNLQTSMIRYIKNEEHYNLLLEQIANVRHTLWIGTADLKDLYVKKGDKAVPFLALLNEKVKQGVSVRLMHAKEPGVNFCKDFDLYPALLQGMERGAMCPRVHFKIILFDLKTVYIGSANITGAAFGMKSERNRNFEAGIFTDDSSLVDEAIEQFDKVWMGSFCKNCGRKSVCKDRIL